MLIGIVLWYPILRAIQRLKFVADDALGIIWERNVWLNKTSASAVLLSFLSAMMSADLDECSGMGGGHNCHIHANCTNLAPRVDDFRMFVCMCEVGYTGDGVHNCEGQSLVHSASPGLQADFIIAA